LLNLVLVNLGLNGRFWLQKLHDNLLFTRAAADQHQHTLHDGSDIGQPPVGLWRSGKIQKRLQCPLHAAYLVFDHDQIFRGQPARLQVAQIDLYQAFDGGQRIA
jgi:hypothetical protein